MKKLCCFPCNTELPDVDVNMSCPSTCCVNQNKANEVKRRSFHKRDHGGKTKECVLQPESSSELCLPIARRNAFKCI